MNQQKKNNYFFILTFIMFVISLLLAIIALIITNINKKTIQADLQNINKELSKGLTTDQEIKLTSDVENAIMNYFNIKSDTIKTFNNNIDSINSSINTLNDTAIRLGNKYFIQSDRTGYLSDQDKDGALFKGMSSPGPFETMQFIKKP